MKVWFAIGLCVMFPFVYGAAICWILGLGQQVLIDLATLKWAR